MNVGKCRGECECSFTLAHRRRRTDMGEHVDGATCSGKHVGDHVASRLLSSQKLSRPQRAVGEQVSIGSAMSELESLTITQQVDRVVAYHIPTAHAEHRDFVAGPRADLAVPTTQLTHVRPHFFHGIE